MSDNPSPIKAIARTKTALDGTEYFEGQDNIGSFKAGANALIADQVSLTLTASVTHTLAGALVLTSDFNIVSTVASVGDSVRLPVLPVGNNAKVFNAGANAITVYPSDATISIDGAGAGVAVTLSAGKRATFYQTSATTIVSAQLGAVSA